MAASPIKELYVSPNGDRWILGENQGGELVVCHDPNKRSGGAPSEIALDVFLSHGEQGPEYQALAEALANLEVAGKKPDHKILAEETQKLDLALGKAVARCWGSLTPEIQHDLFEAAVLSEGETIRQLLAVYLHGKHPRTLDLVQARAMPEPDSLGG